VCARRRVFATDTNHAPRTAQTERLRRLLDPAATLHAGVHVFGPPATGKTSLVLSTLRQSGATTAYIDCRELSSERGILTSLLTQFTEANARRAHGKRERGDAQREGAAPRKRARGEDGERIGGKGEAEAEEEEEEEDEDVASRDSAPRFARPALASLHKTQVPPRDRFSEFVARLDALLAIKGAAIFAVFDHADRLHSRRPELLPALFRMEEVSRTRLCVVLITESVWSERAAACFYREVATVHFRAYDEAALCEILTAALPRDATMPESLRALLSDERAGETRARATRGALRRLVEYVVKLAARATRDLCEHAHLCRAALPVFAEGLRGTDASTDAVERALMRVRAAMVPQLRRLYQHEAPETPSARLEEELPATAQLLLVAAFLASFNPPQEDRRVFSVFTDTQRRTKRQVKAATRAANRRARPLPLLLTGPRAFSVDRMLAIFHIVAAQAAEAASGAGRVPHAGLLPHIATLVALDLLATPSAGADGRSDFSEDTRYVCNVTRELAERFAARQRVNLRALLFEPPE
jgi:origin recognition complex subunit 5